MDALHSMSFGELLDEHGRSNPNRTAVVCGDTRLSYPQLADRVDRLAAVLSNHDVVAGDRILWLGQNCHRLVEGLLAAARLGAVFCPVNWRQSAEELAFVIGDVSPRVVLWQEQDMGDTVRAARELATSEATWIGHDGNYEALVADATPFSGPVDVPSSSPVLCMYTAAFTGRASGALISHDALFVQALVAAKFRDIDPDYVYLNCGPMFHMATFMFTAATFVMGGTNVFLPRMDAERICRLVDSEKCTGAFVIGPTIDKIVELNADRQYDLSSLRTYRSRTAPAWNEMTRLDTSAAGSSPGGYGQTEVGGLLTMGALGNRPIPSAQVRIVNDAGDDVPNGEVGEIVARGPTIMVGYLNRDEENAARRAGGWHHTRDLGRRERDGSITFIGPMTRLIKSAAENIYPAEVERCIAAHPAVSACAVIGVPDPQWTQSVKAIVVLKPEHSASGDEIIAHCREHIASYKKPRTVEFVDALPKKGRMVDYDALDDQFGGGGYPGG